MGWMMLAAIWGNRFWYAVPLVVAISLVYAATRHELMGPILKRALGFGGWIVGFMIAIFVIILAVTWQL